jgi:hydroxymethylglutaryl-CoA lyase
LNDLNISIISLSDTIGVAEPEVIKDIFKNSITAYPTIEFGAHFHSTPQKTREKVEAALAAGCKRFDSAIKGFGGCPMAKDDLTGNVATEKLLEILEEHSKAPEYSKAEFEKAMVQSIDVFPG